MEKIGICILLLISSSTFGQKTIADVLKQYNDNSVPYISAHELAMPKTKALILDARERDEYDVSHIKDAIAVGYNNFKLEAFKNSCPDKQQTIIVYCSLGIRSETIGDKLKAAGYKNVYNLYGGIFEWKNNGFPIYNSEEMETDSIHAFSKEWSQWSTKGTPVFN